MNAISLQSIQYSFHFYNHPLQNGLELISSNLRFVHKQRTTGTEEGRSANGRTAELRHARILHEQRMNALIVYEQNVIKCGCLQTMFSYNGKLYMLMKLCKRIVSSSTFKSKIIN
ncbi:Hypothetical_protein [Hexamita inflata]|uniref:Hypothetical_protein n=1 Tax=Hexamita inflata TaxID=28002 RepID=A0AA86QJL6_9EUKA|nr:Hypothetical protein HINF_LOCUS43328 [Hexamita inflata]